MGRVVKLTPVSSIKPGPGSTVLGDGTIVDPEPYHAADVEFGDGVTVQVERPLTVAKLRQAWREARGRGATSIDDISLGEEIPEEP